MSPVSVEDTEAQRAWPGEQGGSSGRSGSQSPPCGLGQALPVSGHKQRWPSLSPGRSSAILTHAWRPRPWPSEAEAAKVQRDAGPGEAPAGGAWWGLEEGTELSARPPLPAPPLQACFQGHRVLHVPPSHSQRCRRCEATWGPPSMAAGWRGPPRGRAGGQAGLLFTSSLWKARDWSTRSASEAGDIQKTGCGWGKETQERDTGNRPPNTDLKSCSPQSRTGHPARRA